MENKLTRWFVDKWVKPLARQKTPSGEFKVTTPKNSLINNQALQVEPGLSQNKPTVESLLQYPFGLNLVAAFFPLLHNLQSVTNSFARISVHD